MSRAYRRPAPGGGKTAGEPTATVSIRGCIRRRLAGAVVRTARVAGSRSVLLQAAGLAVLASLSPTALLIVAVYLGSARPRISAMFYLSGAVAMSVVMGVVLLVILRSADLSRSAERTPRYGFRLGLGLALLVAAVLLARRSPRASGPAGAPQGLLGRLAADPSPRSAFLVGVLLFAPGATFLAAVQVIATARASVKLTALAVIVVVVINVLLVWLPIVFYLAVPDVTTRYLGAFNGWLRAHGQTVLVWVVVVVGGIMVGNGIHGLVTS